MHRTLWLPVLGVTLTVAIQLHYFAVALWFSLAVGEIVRARARRRIDAPMLVALGLTLLQIPALLPDARAAGEWMRIGPFKSPSLSGHEGQYRALPSLLISVPFALALLLVLRDGLRKCLGSLRGALVDPDTATILALLLLPAVAMLIAVVGGSGLSHQRYALAFTLGASLSAARLAQALKPSLEA